MAMPNFEDVSRTPSEQLVGPDELPVTIAFNDTAYASVLATPEDLDHWALGFAFGEGIITRINQVEAITTDRLRHGLRVRLSVPDHIERLAGERHRVTAASSSCGRCGSAEEAHMMEGLLRLPPAALPAPAQLAEALAMLKDAARPGLHMALGFDSDGQWLASGVDIGRHSALDKLIGEGLAAGRLPAMVLLSSRCSLELVQKVVRAAIPTLATLSHPSHMAVDIARLCALNLICCHRGRKLTLLSRS